MVLDFKLQELEQLADRRQQMEEAMQAVYEQWPEAQWVDEVRGIGMVTAVSILAHIGSIERFPHAENLISYAGLAPVICSPKGSPRGMRVFTALQAKETF